MIAQKLIGLWKDLGVSDRVWLHREEPSLEAGLGRIYRILNFHSYSRVNEPILQPMEYELPLLRCYQSMSSIVRVFFVDKLI